MDEINAGVVVVTRFCTNEAKEFSTYVDYIDRDEAKRNEMLSEYNLYNDYMDNPDKTTGIFMNERIKLNAAEKKELKKQFRIAQEKGSLMWQTVISFDNRWLEQYGLYDSTRLFLDERKIKELVTGAVNRMLKNEKLENAIWSAAIHYNTDNIHVHIATVEPHPMRESKEYILYKTDKDGKTIYEVDEATGKKYKIPILDKDGKPVIRTEYKGRFKGKSIEICKKYVVDQIIGQQELNIDINRIIREDILRKKDEKILAYDNELKSMFMDIYQCLPRTGNKGLWNYNNNIMKNIRPMIDKLTKKYLEIYNPEEMKNLMEVLTRQSEIYKTSYGKGSERDFKDSKVRELYERMGNKILKELREFDKVTGAKEYDPEAAKSIMEMFAIEEENNNEKEMEALYETQLSDEMMINLDELQVDDTFIEWNKEFKFGRQLLYGREKDIIRGIESIGRQAKKGNFLAINELGNIYARGIGVDIDKDKSYYYYEKAYKALQNLENKNKKNKGYIKYCLGKANFYGLGCEKNYEKAFEFFTEAKLNNCKFANYNLANMFYTGNGTVVDKEKAYEHYLQCGDTPLALYRIAKMKEIGEATTVDIEGSKEYYKKAYEGFLEYEEKRPDGNTEYRLGMMNLKGEGVEENREMAELFLAMAAENGNIYAQYQYAKLLLENDNQDNLDKALAMLKNSAEKGNEMSTYMLGKLYLNDKRLINPQKGVYYLEKVADNIDYAKYELAKFLEQEGHSLSNENKAIKLYEELVANENEYAAYKLARIYNNPQSVNYNQEMAEKNFLIASKFGNVFADYNLGKLYEDKESTLFNMEKAIKYYSKCSDMGNEYATFKLGNIYADKNSPYFDEKEAINNYERIADGNVYAAYALGKIYENRESEFFDLDRAIECYEKIADENIYAAMKLGKIYESDEKLDIYKAIENYQKAAQQDNSYAQYRLGMIYKDRQQPVYDIETAVELLKLSAKNGNQFANLSLGYMYLSGDGVNMDKDKAFDFFYKASCQGNEDAMVMLSKLNAPRGFRRTRTRLSYNLRHHLDRSIRRLNNAFKDRSDEVAIARNLNLEAEISYEK